MIKSLCKDCPKWKNIFPICIDTCKKLHKAQIILSSSKHDVNNEYSPEDALPINTSNQ